MLCWQPVYLILRKFQWASRVCFHDRFVAELDNCSFVLRLFDRLDVLLSLNPADFWALPKAFWDLWSHSPSIYPIRSLTSSAVSALSVDYSSGHLQSAQLCWTLCYQQLWNDGPRLEADASPVSFSSAAKIRPLCRNGIDTLWWRQDTWLHGSFSLLLQIFLRKAPILGASFARLHEKRVVFRRKPIVCLWKALAWREPSSGCSLQMFWQLEVWRECSHH